MNVAKVSLAAFLVAVSAAFGCSAESSGAEHADGRPVSEGQLLDIGAPFVGTYTWQKGGGSEFGDYEQLTLDANGTYAANVEATLVDPDIRCIQFPCTVPETGTWTASDASGEIEIQVRPTTGSLRTSTAVLSNDVLELTRSDKTTTLIKERTASACAAVLCLVGTVCVEVDGEATCVTN